MADQETFSFKVELGAKDLWLFSLYHSYKGMMGLFNVFFTAAALFVLITNHADMTAWQNALMALCALMFTVVQPAMLYLKAKKQARTPLIQEPMELVFTPETIHISQGGQGGELTWEQVGRVEAGPSMLIIYMDRIHAYLLPKRVLGNREGEFRALVRRSLPKIRCRRI